MKPSELPIEEQWKLWIEENPVEDVEDISDEEMRETIMKDLEFVSQMSVGEYTLYQKWLEVHRKFPTENVSTLFGEEVQLKDPNQKKAIEIAKSNIWRPEHPDDYMKLKPKLIYTDDSKTIERVGIDGSVVEERTKRNDDLASDWNLVRTFTSTMKNNPNIGRNLNFLVMDEVTGKYLGVICISSDFLDLTPRDKWIGWEREKKTQGNMINYTAIGSTIVPTQPLGFNYVGGKLLALLCLSDTVQNLWKEKYGDVLTGVTTTSLYGKAKQDGLSQYDNLKYWKKMGFSSGSMAFETHKRTQAKLLKWMHKHHTYKYFEWYGAVKPSGMPFKRDHRNRSFHFTYSKLKIPKHLISCEHGRGIYFAPLYENTREFLRGEIDESQLSKVIDTSDDAIVELWKTKYASKRIKSLVKNDRVSDETLFYDDLIFLTWEETKAKYLNEVGR
jgi:hypothetical protein